MGNIIRVPAGSLNGDLSLIQAEGAVLGVCARMFTIAGPVLVFGSVASVVYGVIYYIWQLIV